MGYKKLVVFPLCIAYKRTKKKARPLGLTSAVSAV